MSVPSLSWQTIAQPPPPPALPTGADQIRLENVMCVCVCWVQVAATATGAAHGELLVDLSAVPVRNTHARALHFPCSFSVVSPNLDRFIYAKTDRDRRHKTVVTVSVL